jgi:hypothetical protein
MTHFRRILLGAIMAGLLTSGHAAKADDIIYSNLATFSGNGFAAGSTTVVGGVENTLMAADDITPIAGQPGTW